MYTYNHILTKEHYNQKIKGNYSADYIQHTAKGYEETRKRVTIGQHRYFLSAQTEKDYFLQCETSPRFSCFFRIDGDAVTLYKVTNNGRTYTAPRYLRKYTGITAIFSSIIKYGGIVNFEKLETA